MCSKKRASFLMWLILQCSKERSKRLITPWKLWANYGCLPIRVGASTKRVMGLCKVLTRLKQLPNTEKTKYSFGDVRTMYSLHYLNRAMSVTPLMIVVTMPSPRKKRPQERALRTATIVCSPYGSAISLLQSRKGKA